METKKILVPSKKQVKRAGEILSNEDASEKEKIGAMQVLSQWRALHHYPINTFQATLRKKCKKLGLDKSIIAQRLKRTPSIIKKLSRFPEMNLARMQDIGGLRVIVPNIKDVEKLHQNYLNNNRLPHDLVLPAKDYIKNPKDDGYRSLHQVFKYQSQKKPELDGLQIELQIRTKLQHAWATAVETLGLIEKQSFKTGEGSEEYRRFFLLCSALFAIKEQTPIPQALANMDRANLVAEIKQLIEKLHILERLNGVAISAKHIESTSKTADYYVMKLDIESATVKLIPFTKNQFDEAKDFYLSQEQNANQFIDTVLISAGSVREIKKAYPNYFLDTKQFIKEIEAVLKL